MWVRVWARDARVRDCQRFSGGTLEEECLELDSCVASNSCDCSVGRSVPVSLTRKPRDRPIGARKKNGKVASKLPWKEPDTRCNGRKSGGNGYCGQKAGWGTDHPGIGRCKKHGGATKLYGEQVQKIRAYRSVEQYGLPVEIDPHTALIQELERTVGHVEWLRIRVGELQTAAMHGPVGGGQGAIPEEKANIWIEMYRAERAHLIRVAKSCVDAGIEERRVQIAEAQGMMIATVIKAILTELVDAPGTKLVGPNGSVVTVDGSEPVPVLERPEVPEIVRRHLTTLPTVSEARALPEGAVGDGGGEPQGDGEVAGGNA